MPGYNKLKTLIRRLNKRSRIVNEHKLWLGATNKDGYGKTTFESKDILIHRLSAFLYLNLDLSSLNLVLHKNTCPYKNCWAPECLYIGDHKDNMNDVKDKNVCSKCLGKFDLFIKRSNGIISRRCKRCLRKYNRLYNKMDNSNVT